MFSVNAGHSLRHAQTKNVGLHLKTRMKTKKLSFCNDSSSLLHVYEVVFGGCLYHMFNIFIFQDCLKGKIHATFSFSSLRLAIIDHYEKLFSLLSGALKGVRSSERHVHTQMNLSFSLASPRSCRRTWTFLAKPGTKKRVHSSSLPLSFSLSL